ncbi:hypothetical protein [Salinicola avicenniae]|uniref:hypothetical protein n=1 Tax=Salinicola avicenniae TaxID=2916836 RepID=UPI00207368D1|nr:MULTISPECIES: hypothetical protein [unclassified Salinicola]
MRELIFDVAIRPTSDVPRLWEALVPALPGLSVVAESDLLAFDRLQALMMTHLSDRLMAGLGVPAQARIGQYLGDYGLVFWQFLRVKLGPGCGSSREVEPVFPDIDELMRNLVEETGRE